MGGQFNARIEQLERGSENGGGSSLPSYTSADIGKVLTIGEGGETVEPKWESVQSGGGVKIVELLQNTDTENNACDLLIKYNNNVLTSYEAVATFITENPAIIGIFARLSSYNVILPTRSTIVEGDRAAYYLFSVDGHDPMQAGWTSR